MTEKNTYRDVAAVAGVPVLILGAIATIAAIGAWSAFVGYKLYGWFVIPLGAPVLSWWHIWGLLLIYHLVTYKEQPVDRNQPKDPRPIATMVAGILGRALGIAFVLLLGWMIHGVMT
jgi:hypothetical protein